MDFEHTLATLLIGERVSALQVHPAHGEVGAHRGEGLHSERIAKATVACWMTLAILVVITGV